VELGAEAGWLQGTSGQPPPQRGIMAMDMRIIRNMVVLGFANGSFRSGENDSAIGVENQPPP